MSFSTVLIVAADAEFTRQVIDRWHAQTAPPSFVTLCDARVPESVLAAADLVICGPAPSDDLVSILRQLYAAGRPAICVVADAATSSLLRKANSRTILLRSAEGWVDNLLNVALELLRSAEALSRARSAERALTEAQIDAALGRFILDMRHGLNNALTSILGNSELLLLEPEKLADDVREQIATLHSMGLRIHDILLRFTAMEMEMKLYSQSHDEIPIPPRTMMEVAPPHSELRTEASAHGTGLS